MALLLFLVQLDHVKHPAVDCEVGEGVGGEVFFLAQRGRPLLPQLVLDAFVRCSAEQGHEE